MAEAESLSVRRFRLLMLVGGPVFGALVYLAMPESFVDAEGGEVVLGAAGRAAAAVGVWMAVWWLSEAVHISVTALLPLVAFPLLGVRAMGETGASYGHPIVFLFMGGFIISLAMQRWGLHKRFALWTIRLIGTEPRRLVLGFMVATALLSLWISNTATALMMLPIALSVLDRLGVKVLSAAEDGEAEAVSGGDRNLAVALMLGIAYAASIGGLGTPLGSPPNFIARAYFDQQGIAPVSFTQWMGLALPIVAVFLPIAWLLLTRVLYPVRAGSLGEGGEAAGALRSKEPMNRGEKWTAVVFGLAVLAWVSRGSYETFAVGGVTPFKGSAGDAVIGMAAALALFVLPVSTSPRRFVMNWATAVKMPWGVLILFGGGLALASALDKTNVSAYLAVQLGALEGMPAILMVAATVTLVIFLTELTSNTATATTLVPILGALAIALGIDPHELIMPAALAATCAFMLPVATPPNAIVYSSGYIRMSQMVRAGVMLNVIGVVLVTLFLYFLMPLVLG